MNLVSQLRLSVAREVTQEVPPEIGAVLCQELATHFKARGLEAELGAWEATVLEYQSSSSLSILSVELQGTCNNLPATLRARAKRYPGRMAHGGGFGVGEVINLAVVLAAQGALALGGAPAHLQQCLAEVTAELSQQLDNLLAHQESPASRTWICVLWARWIAVALIFGGFMIVGALEKGLLFGLCFALLMGWFPAVALFFQIYCLGLVCMPTRFFLQDPRGRKALARSGVSSVLLMKVLCVIISFFLTLPELITVGMFYEHWQGAPK
jgi:hypothetical protein